MLLRRRQVRIVSERLRLRPPAHGDFRAWADLRDRSRGFLQPWEPTWSSDHLSRRAFTNRVYWAQRAVAGGTGLPLFLFDNGRDQLLGAVTLDNIRRGPAQAASCGYWIGEGHARNGYMSEAIRAVVHYAFTSLDLSRIDAACLPENAASRGVLEKTGFKYEGVAQSYLQINGRWRNHVLYANLRGDRRGRSDQG
ncbi:MAG: GNAT family N-acetyltransferase [Qingshengfaniella sp.]